MSEMHGGGSANNYKITTHGQSFFLKVYDKKKTQALVWTENIHCYMPILVWLNENTPLRGRMLHPLKSAGGDYCFENDESVFLLFEWLKGETLGKSMTHTQLLEAAELIACLHGYGSEIPVSVDNIQEDFSVPFCHSLEGFVMDGFAAAPAEMREILQPYVAQLLSKSKEVKRLSEKAKQKSSRRVLCHTDAHGYNFIQGEQLALVDWEGIKLAPAEADLMMFSKKEYWEVFWGRYGKLRPRFVLDDELFLFYILRRKMEDIWDFIERLLDNSSSLSLSFKQRECCLAFLSECCKTLDDVYFEL